MSKKKMFNLTVFCEGATPSFYVDQDDLDKFENSFDKTTEGNISFKDYDNNGSVVLRNQKLTGYKKSIIAEGAFTHRKYPEDED